MNTPPLEPMPGLAILSFLGYDPTEGLLFTAPVAGDEDAAVWRYDIDFGERNQGVRLSEDASALAMPPALREPVSPRVSTPYIRQLGARIELLVRVYHLTISQDGCDGCLMDSERATETGAARMRYKHRNGRGGVAYPGVCIGVHQRDRES